MTKFRWLLLCSFAVAVSCTKAERPASADSPEARESEQAAQPTAGKTDDKPESAPTAPKVAIGATRTELLQLAQSTLAETDEYKLDVGVPDDATAGKEQAIKLLVTPKKGWKLNKGYPTKLVVSAPADVKVSKPKQTADDAVEFAEHSGAAWHVQFTSSAAGEKKFGGEFEFAVCTETTCVPKREKLAIAVNVK